MALWKRLIIPLCFVAVFIVGGKPSEVSACSCVMPPPPEEALNSADAVFSGEVVDIVDNKGMLNGNGVTVYFEVDESWKGINKSEVSVTTGYNDGDCGFPFEVGQSYLVYASTGDMYRSNALSTTICQRTTNLANATEDLNVLGEGEKVEESNEKVEDNNDLLSWSTMKFILVALLVLVASFYFTWRIKQNKRARS